VDSLEKRQGYVETKVEVQEVTYDTVDTRSINEKISSMSSRDIQSALREAGYYDGAIDGKLGPKSRKAIRDFQTDRSLKVDGIAGVNTKKALLQYLSQ
jgi:peptidoglycan hydrolase-like protein with peptidoglycan-binding domain